MKASEFFDAKEHRCGLVYETTLKRGTKAEIYRLQRGKHVSYQIDLIDVHYHRHEIKESMTLKSFESAQAMVKVYQLSLG